MYYVPDGTEKCGFYECEDCRQRFLDIRIAPRIPCPYCGEEPDMELGPDDDMPDVKESAKLLEMIQRSTMLCLAWLLQAGITSGSENAGK